MNNHDGSHKNKSAVLYALRLNWKECSSIGILFLVTILSWCITEFSTTLFRNRMETELQSVTASDISVRSSFFPDNTMRESLRKIAKKNGAQVSESVEFSYTIEGNSNIQKTDSGSRFLTTNVRIVDASYPLYGSIAYSGAFTSGALVDGEIFDTLANHSFIISGKNIPITGKLFKAPGVSENPFVPNRDILIPSTLLPFDAVTASGAGYRIQYRMEFAEPIEGRKILLRDIETFLKDPDNASYRVREEQGSGGSFSDIAKTLNDFLGSILYSTILIALSSFIVSFSRFALERRKLVQTLLWIGLPESSLVKKVFSRLLALFGFIGIASLTVFALLPGVTNVLLYKGVIFLSIAIILNIWILTEVLMKNSNLLSEKRLLSRIGFTVTLLTLLTGYLLLAGESIRPLLYALVAVTLLERFSTVFFRGISALFSNDRNATKSRFFILDTLRSFRNAPALGKVSFSVFFLLSATLSAVFLFSLAFQDSLRQTSDSPINTFVINLLPEDYLKLSRWIPKEDFYSTLRARIVSVNERTLSEHLGTTEISQEFSREFNITDGETKNQILEGKQAVNNREVTVDHDFSKMLGVSVGDSLDFSIAGRSFPFSIVGIRESKRSGVSPFFFFQIAENAIPGAPKTYFLATSVTGDRDAWKKRIISDSGTHVSFLDIGAILEQVRSYSRLVLQGVLGLLGYIGGIGFLAFLTTEKSFFLLKIRKIQLYRVLGATKSDGFKLLFFESLLGNIIPMLFGAIVGGVVLIYFLRNNPILKITPIIIGTAFLALTVFFLIAYFYARYSVRKQIWKTDPKIGAVD